MFGSKIKEVLNKEKDILPYFRGLFAIDQIPKRLKRNCFIIVNKDTIKEQGSHWFAVSNFHDQIEIFDSLGTDAPFVQTYFGHLGPHINFNSEQYQPNESTSCAYFSIYYCQQRVLNFDVTFENLLEEIFVADNLKKNEKIVEKYFRDGEFLEK
jgi:hypothetical protein